MTYALITGASKGIGKAIAIELAKKKNNLIIVSRNEAQLATLAEEIVNDYKVECKYIALDLSENKAADQLFDWCIENKLTINILVNNAGYGLSGRMDNYTMAEYGNMMQVNMATPLALILKFLPMLKQQPKSYILNIASSAVYQAVPGLGVYAASKSFVFSFSRSLRFELRNSNVSVTVVNPGTTDTDFANRAQVTNEKALKTAAKLNMTPSAVAKIAVDGMYAEKAEVIPGFINKLGAFLALILPKKALEGGAAGIYGV